MNRDYEISWPGSTRRWASWTERLAELEATGIAARGRAGTNANGSRNSATCQIRPASTTSSSTGWTSRPTRTHAPRCAGRTRPVCRTGIGDSWALVAPSASLTAARAGGSRRRLLRAAALPGRGRAHSRRRSAQAGRSSPPAPRDHGFSSAAGGLPGPRRPRGRGQARAVTRLAAPRRPRRSITSWSGKNATNAAT